MSGISASTGTLAAKKALHQVAGTVLGEQAVDVTFGIRWPIVEKDWFSVLGGRSEIDPDTIQPGRSYDETITLDIEIGAFTPERGNAGELVAQQRAFEVYNLVADHIRTTDITLGGTVLWCAPGAIEFDGATAEDDVDWGALCVIAATFVCRHKIRTI